jgi:DNA invertase Pin-like site-specific DNA recombinase
MNEYVIAKYIRLSQDDAISDSLSIPNQRLLLDSHIEDMDIPGVQVLEFVDNGFTGTNVERPGFQEMIELVRCGRINCIIVKDFSRFARNALESGYYIEKVFPLYRIRFIAVGDRFDSSDYKDGTGGIDVAFKFMMNEYYSNDLSKKVKSALHILMKNGEHIVGGAIYGYRKNDSGKWEYDLPAAEVVHEIFKMALDGKTTAQIRDNLFADRRLAPREYEYVNKGKEVTPKFNWTTQAIWRILTNEQYTGTYVAGKRETSRVGSKAQIEKDRSEWIIIPNSHPPIVSKEDFERVQAILKSPKEALSNGRERSVHAGKLFARIESGERKPAAALYGYCINSSKALEVDETASGAVRMIFDLALKGYTARDIAEELQRAKHLPPGEYFKLTRGGSIQPTYRWSALRVREILKNEQYTGAYVAGRTFQDDNGRKYHTPPSEWVIIPDKHPAIVSKEVFEQIQTLHSQGKRKMQPHNYLLKGKIVCGACGRAMIYGNTSTQPVYRCMNTHADPAAACHKLKISAAEVESAVMTIIRKQAEVVLNSDDLSGFRKTTATDKWIDGFGIQLNHADIEKQVSLLSIERQECYERFINLEIDRDTFHLMKADYTARIDRLTQHLAVSGQSARKREADKKTIALAKDALSETASPKDIVDALVEKVLVFPGNHIEIHWKFANFAENL